MLDKKLLASLLSLASVVELRDPYTGGHLWRVGTFSKLLAAQAGLDAADVFSAALGGFLHDLGKIGVPDAILRKTGKLTDEEYAVIKAHPVMGAELLRDHPLAETVTGAVLRHHERPDGRGYPDGLQGNEAPIIARIVGVADAFDAMTSTRSYRPGMSIERALEIIREQRGVQFDTVFADAFAVLHQKGELQHIVGHSDHGRLLATCPTCGPIVAVARGKGDGDTVFCRNCGSELLLHRAGGSFEVEKVGTARDPSVLRPMPETDVIADFVEAAPRVRSHFFLGRIATMVGLGTNA